MAYTLGNKCAKNLCKWTVLLQVIIKNVVTCLFGNTVYIACGHHWIMAETQPDFVPLQNWMAAYLGYTLQMKTLFHGLPVMVHDTHTRRRRMAEYFKNCVAVFYVSLLWCRGLWLLYVRFELCIVLQYKIRCLLMLKSLKSCKREVKALVGSQGPVGISLSVVCCRNIMSMDQ